MNQMDMELLELSKGKYNGRSIQFWLDSIITILDKLDIGSSYEISNENYKSIQDCVKALKFLSNYLDLCLYDASCENNCEDYS